MQALTAFALLAAIVWLAYWPWQDYCVDVARQRIFVLRDELFDLAANGDISFDCKPYRETRSAMNASIRFAHRMTWLETLLIGLTISRSGKGKFFQQTLDEIENDNVRSKVRRLQRRLSRTITLLMIVRSPALILLTLCLMPLLLAVALLLPAAKNERRRFERSVGEMVVRESQLTCAS